MSHVINHGEGRVVALHFWQVEKECARAGVLPGRFSLDWGSRTRYTVTQGPCGSLEPRRSG